MRSASDPGGAGETEYLVLDRSRLNHVEVKTILPEPVISLPGDKQADEPAAEARLDKRRVPKTHSTEGAQSGVDERLKKAAAESFQLMGED
jgi:hypothetical protein